MDADQALQVWIKLGFIGQDQADAARKAIADTKDATGELTKKTDEAVISHHELRKVLDDIGNAAAPGMGRALGELAFGPIGAALALGSVFEMLRKKIEDTNAEMDKMAERAALAFSNVQANLFDAIRNEEFSTDKIDAYFKKIEDDAGHAKTVIDNALALTKAKDSATQEVNKAKEQLALEQIKNNPNLTDAQKSTAEASAKDYYARENARLEKDQNDAELKSATAERDALQKQLDDLLFKQNKENSVTPEKQAQIDRAVSQLDPKDALRIQYEKDKAAGTIDYAKISNSAAAADTAVQLESLKNKLGLDPQTGAMTDSGDAQRANDKNKELQKKIDAIDARIAGARLTVNTSGFANERENAQTALDFYKTQRAPLEAEIAANNVPVEADKKRIEQLENAAKIIAEGADEQKKLNEAIAAAKEKVTAASAKVDLTTQTTGIKNSTIDDVLKTNEATQSVKPGVAELELNKGIADRVSGGQATSPAEQQRLIAAASKIAGHNVDLATAVQIVETSANHIGAFIDQVSRLGAAMSLFNSGDIAKRVSRLEDDLQQWKLNVGRQGQ